MQAIHLKKIKEEHDGPGPEARTEIKPKIPKEPKCKSGVSYQVLRVDSNGFKQASQESTIKNYDGFAIKSIKVLTLRAPTSQFEPSDKSKDPAKLTVQFFYRSGKMGVNIDSFKAAQTAPVDPVFAVWTYRGYTKNEPTADDGVDFVFCGDKEGNILKDCYMSLYDLELRVASKSTTIDARLKVENEYMPSATKLKGLPFRIWNSEGKLLNHPNLPNWTPNMKAAFNEILKRCERFEDRSRKNIKDPWFKFMCDTAMNAQKQKSRSYTVLGRFWDQELKDGLKVPLLLVISEDATSSLPNRDDAVKAGIDAIYEKSKMKFKPELTIEFAQSLTSYKKDGYVTVGRHPNLLFQLMAEKKSFRELIKAAKGKLWLPPLLYKFGTGDTDTNGQAKMKREFDKVVAKIGPLIRRERADGQPHFLYKEIAGTATTVTSESVGAANGKKRSKTQNAVMGNNSATVLMNALFEPTKDQFAIQGEWLHRSAHSFGGIHQGKFELPLSSNKPIPNPILALNASGSVQSVQNLVLGTPQTNTMMLRYEMFIKRFVENATPPQGEKTRISVRTRLLHGTGSMHTFNRHRSSLWFGHFLLYYFTTAEGTNPPCQQSRVFFPFSRHTPMRLEVELDLMMEQLCYGWQKEGLDLEDVELASETANVSPNDVKDANKTLNFEILSGTTASLEALNIVPLADNAMIIEKSDTLSTDTCKVPEVEQKMIIEGLDNDPELQEADMFNELDGDIEIVIPVDFREEPYP